MENEEMVLMQCAGGYSCDILMVHPEHFRVEYLINPYMTDDNGNLNQIDPEKAISQWDALLSVLIGRKHHIGVLFMPTNGIHLQI